MNLTLQPLVPWWALAAILLPLLGLACWQVAVAGRRGPDGVRRPGAPRLAWVRRAAIVVVLAVVGLGPSTISANPDTTMTNVDVFFVVDRTGSMAAEDYDGTAERLDGVRHDIRSITADIPDARYSVISFDSQASRQLPLTTDARAITTWVETFKREITLYSKGSLTDRPLDELRSALEGSVAQHPANIRLVYFLSDGEQTAEGTPRSFAGLAPLIDGGAVLGYGTEQGGRMKEYDPYSLPSAAEYLKDYTETDANGDTPDALSKIDEESLRTLAGQLGVPYVHRDTPTPTTAVVGDLDAEQIAADGRRNVSSYRVVVWPAALALAALLGWEAWSWATATARSVRRRPGVRA